MIKAFNRTILELKSRRKPVQINEKNTFNRTILELKFFDEETRNKVHVAFNRTILELKFFSGSWHVAPGLLLIGPYWN